MRARPLIGTALLLLSFTLDMPAAVAQSQEQPLSNNTISAATLAGSTGRIAVNSAAGNGSTQANLAAIGTGGGLASVAIENDQRVLSYLPARTSAQSEIGADAFRGTSGLISVNQSSGNGNTQANLAAIAVGNLSEVSIEQLGRVNAAPSNLRHAMGSNDTEQRQKVAIADSAFAGAHGIVQINQLAGSGNSTANVFALSISAGMQ